MSQRIALAVLLAALPVAAAAEDTVPTPEIEQPGQQAPAPEIVPDPGAGGGTIDDGMGLIEEGGRQILQGLQDELKPLLDEFAGGMEPRLRALATQLGPLVEELAEMIGDFTLYEAPERLPNGDILIPRRHPEELTPPPPSGLEPDAGGADGGGQIDL